MDGKTPVMQNSGAPLPTFVSTSGNASGTTRSAIGAGSITVRNASQQTQDISTLSRNTDDANGHIDKIFDKDKIEKDQAVVQLAQQVTGQTIVMISDQLISKAKQEAANNLLADKNYQSASPDIQKKLMDAANLAVDQKYGIGSTYWTAATAISGALAGLAGGNGGAALAGGLAPYLSEAVKIATTKEGEVNVPANLAGHALAGALIAYLQGGSLSAGAVGGAGGEAAARLISAELYPGIKAADLTNEQKANISALSTLAAGLAGGVLNDSSMAGVQAAAAGKVAVENNYLNSQEKSRQTELNHKQDLTPQEQQERDALNKKDAETSKALVDACLGGDATSCAAARKDALEKQDTYQNLGYQNSKEMQEGYQQIQALLNGTSPEALQTQAIFNGIVDSYVRMGMSEADAKTAVGYQLGSMYVVGGIAGIGAGKAVEEGLVPSNTGTKGIVPNTPNSGSSLKIGETQIINEVSVTRVGRWMSPDELAQMQSGNKVVQGSGGQTFISTNGASAFKATAPNGSVYVEFDVPTNSDLTHH
jgi:filamentous hemagglutinin